MSMTAWYNSADFRFTKAFEDNFEGIRDEAKKLLAEGWYHPHEQSRESPTHYTKLADRWLVLQLIRRRSPVRHRDRHPADFAPFTWSLVSQFAEIMTCTVG